VFVAVVAVVVACSLVHVMFYLTVFGICEEAGL
jgi:hypothetical protein